MKSKFSLIALLFVIFLNPGFSDDWVTDIGGSSGDWGDSANWDTGAVPNNINLDNAIFQDVLSGPGTVNLGAPYSVYLMLFTSSQTYTLADSGGGSLTFNTSIGAIGSQPQIISVPLRQGPSNQIISTAGSLTIYDYQTSTVTLSGDIHFAGPISNVISDATISTSVSLEKTGGAVALTGRVGINSGATLTTPAGFNNQFGPNAFLVLSTNTSVANFNNTDQTFGQFFLGAGNLQSTGNIYLNSTGFAFSIGNSTVPSTCTIHLTGASGGTVATGAGTTSTFAGNLDLGSAIRPFAINGSSLDGMNVSGVVSGSGGINKNSNGTLQFSGSSANTYSGLTTVNAGTLQLAKNSGTTAIAGSVNVAGGTLVTLNPNQFSNSSSVTLDSGIFNLNGNAQTFSALTYNGGTVSNNTAGLSLSSTGTALTVRNVSLPGTIHLTGASGGSVVFDASNNGTATISNIDVGTVNRTFNIANGTQDSDMIINASSGTGGFTKTGLGTLTLAGTHTHTGSTSLLSGGTLDLAGALTVGSLTTNPATTLRGTGPLQGGLILNGILEPGEGIGILNLSSPSCNFGSTSVINIELDPNLGSDLINISGSGLTIAPGSTLSVTPTPNVLYPKNFTIPVINTSGTITGTFTNILNSFLSFEFQVTYTPTSVLLEGTGLPFSTIVTSGNAGQVARYLDSLNPTPGSDLANVLSNLHTLNTIDELTAALLELQPSDLKGLSLVQENNAIRTRYAISNRTSQYANCCCENACLCDRPWNFWLDLQGNFLDQHQTSNALAFKNTTGFVTLGIDRSFPCDLLLGASAGYSYSDTMWQYHQLHGKIQSGYGSVYGSYFGNYFYSNATLMGAYNSYFERRSIEFLNIDRKAKASFQGGEFLAYGEFGGLFRFCRLNIQPYISADYLYLHQGSFKEHGADSIDLYVGSTHYKMVRAATGLTLGYRTTQVGFEGTVSYIRESRFGGKKYTVGFVSQDSTFEVFGLAPNRNLISPAFSITLFTKNENLSISTDYEGEFGHRYSQQNVQLSFLYEF